MRDEGNMKSALSYPQFPYSGTHTRVRQGAVFAFRAGQGLPKATPQGLGLDALEMRYTLPDRPAWRFAACRLSGAWGYMNTPRDVCATSFLPHPTPPLFSEERSAHGVDLQHHTSHCIC